MKKNFSNLCAIALLTTIFNLIPNLAVAEVAERSQLESENINIDRDYVGDFCILLGPIQKYADVRLDWGAFQGERRVYPDSSSPNETYGVNVNAKGNNVTDATLYTSRGLGSAYPQVHYSRCQDLGHGISNPSYLDWSDRD